MKFNRQHLFRIAAFVFVVAISVYIFFIPEEQIAVFEGYGYPGIFLISILANATVILPAPILFVVTSLGAKFSPLLVGIFAGVGSGIGEFSGYLAGYSGQGLMENSQLYQRMVVWVKKNGPLTILVLAFLPNPLFDITGIAAGALRMPFWKFLLWCIIGKTLKMILFAYIGSGIVDIPFIENWIK